MKRRTMNDGTLNDSSTSSHDSFTSKRSHTSQLGMMLLLSSSALLLFLCSFNVCCCFCGALSIPGRISNIHAINNMATVASPFQRRSVERSPETGAPRAVPDMFRKQWRREGRRKRMGRRLQMLTRKLLALRKGQSNDDESTPRVARVGGALSPFSDGASRNHFQRRGQEGGSFSSNSRRISRVKLLATSPFSTATALRARPTTALHMVLSTPDTIIEQASTQGLLDTLLDESVRTQSRQPIMIQFNPNRSWIWR